MGARGDDRNHLYRRNEAAFHLSRAALGFATLPLICSPLVTLILATYAALTTQRRSGSLA